MNPDPADPDEVSGPGSTPMGAEPTGEPAVPPAAPAGPPAPGLAPALLLYTGLRLLLIVALTAILTVFGVPLVVALLFAILLQLPLAWLLFGAARRRLNAAVAVRAAPRRAERERLRRALTGEE